MQSQHSFSDHFLQGTLIGLMKRGGCRCSPISTKVASTPTIQCLTTQHANSWQNVPGNSTKHKRKVTKIWKSGHNGWVFPTMAEASPVNPWLKTHAQTKSGSHTQTYVRTQIRSTWLKSLSIYRSRLHTHTTHSIRLNPLSAHRSGLH